MEGTIKVLKEGYGFITSEGQEKDTFFHAASLGDVSFESLSVGDTLRFEIGEGNNGKQQATNIEVVEAGAED